MIMKIYRYIKRLIIKESIPDSFKLNELIYANIFHDYIRDKHYLSQLSLSPTGMAANYSFLYLLARIISEIKPSSVLEIGLGQSSRLIQAILSNETNYDRYDILEDNLEWINQFDFAKNKSISILHKSLTNIVLGNAETRQIFMDLKSGLIPQYDLYVIDGPRGIKNHSRFDICILAEDLEPSSDFVIIMDDYNRKGEKQTIKSLFKILHSKNISYDYKVFSATRSQIVIFSQKHQLIYYI